MLSTLRNQSFEDEIFKNRCQGEFLPSFSVKNNPIYQEMELVDQGNNVEVSKHNINILPGGITNHMNKGNEIRILINEETIAMDFTTTGPTPNKIVISYPPREFSTRVMEITLGITGQAAISLLAYATTTVTTPSSKRLRGLNFVVAANAVGFIGTFLGMWFRKRSKKRVATASVVAGKIGGIAAACAIIVVMGLFLPANAIYMWFVGFVCLFPAAAVAFS